MKQRYQYRIYPTQPQIHNLARLFGCCRVVWNDALALCLIAEKLPKNNDLQKNCITLAKKTEDRGWLGEVSNIPLQQSVIDLGTAFKNYFDSLKGNRLGRKMGRPLSILERRLNPPSLSNEDLKSFDKHSANTLEPLKGAKEESVRGKK
jgi:putative transposase